MKYIETFNTANVVLDVLSRMKDKNVDPKEMFKSYIPTLWDMIHETYAAFKATSSFCDNRIIFYIPHLDVQMNEMMDIFTSQFHMRTESMMNGIFNTMLHIMRDIMKIAESINITISYCASSRRLDWNYGRIMISMAIKTMIILDDYETKLKIVCHRKEEELPAWWHVSYTRNTVGTSRGHYKRWDIYLPSDEMVISQNTTILGEIDIDFKYFPLSRLIQMEEKNILECVVYGAYDWFLYDDLAQHEEILGDRPNISGNMKYILTIRHFDEFIKSIIPKSRSQSVSISDYVTIGENRLRDFLDANARHMIVRYKK